MTSRVIMLAMLLMLSLRAQAHHSTAIYDTSTNVAITGVVARYEWANPHVYLWIEELPGDPEAVVWQVEGGPPAILRRSGVSEEQLAVGDTVTVHGHPGRAAEKHLLLMNYLDKSRGGTLNFGQANAIGSIMTTRENVPEPATGLQGAWGSLLNMSVAGFFISPDDSMLTERGRQALVDAKEGRLPGSTPCTPATAPSIMVAPDIKLIEIESDIVRISREWDGVVRTVHMNRNTHDGAEPSPQGHSIGRWDGEDLVIDTRLFVAEPRGNGYSLPSSEEKHLIERLRLDADRTHLLYSFVLEDPVYLASPFISEAIQWTYRPDFDFRPAPCDVENALRHTR